MDLEPHRPITRKDLFEDLRTLRDSDYWPYLSKKNQDDIQNLLAGGSDRSEPQKA